MPVKIRSTGPMLDGRYKTLAPRVIRRWAAGVLKLMRAYARSIAPVDTGAYRKSIVYRTTQRGMDIRGTLYSTDIPGKVKVIEYGFPPARPGLKGRVGRFVFKSTFDRHDGLLRTQGRVLQADLARELGK